MDPPFIPLSVTLSTVSFVLIAQWYVLPKLLELPRADAISPILLFHSFRHIGLAFLIPGVTAEPLDLRFAEPAAWGDLLAAALAFAALGALRRDWRLAIPLVWVFNVFGTVDLLNAVYQGLTHVPEGNLGATYFIPAIVVPALLVSHFVVFVLLMRRRAVITVTV